MLSRMMDSRPTSAGGYERGRDATGTQTPPEVVREGASGVGVEAAEVRG